MKENGHWYSRDGLPQHFIAKKDGSGNRPTTLADARKNGWLPSVTTILKVLDKPALVKWKVEQACMAVLTSPRRDGEELDAFMQRVLYEDREQEQEAAQAADRGTEMHAALESLFKGEDVADASILPWVLPAFQAVSANGKAIGVEQVLVGDGYAGKCDLIQDAPSGNVLIWDWKTTKKIPNDSWPEAKLQLAAYAEIVEDMYCKPVSVANVYISTVECGAYAIHTTVDWKAEWQRGFAPLLQLWQHLNRYTPPKQNCNDDATCLLVTTDTV